MILSSRSNKVMFKKLFASTYLFVNISQAEYSKEHCPDCDRLNPNILFPLRSAFQVQLEVPLKQIYI